MAPNCHQHEAFPFMTCVLEVNVQNPKWQKMLAAILNGIQGVRSFRMDSEGKVFVSGTVDPAKLLKRLGKAGQNAKICKWQFGQCSSNLFLTTKGEYDHSYYYGGRGAGGLHSSRDSSNLFLPSNGHTYWRNGQGGQYGSQLHCRREQFAHKKTSNFDDCVEEEDMYLPGCSNDVACCNVM